MSFTYPVPYTPAPEVPPSNSESGGAGQLETPAGSVNGSNAVFTFTSPPIVVYRNGVNETRLGSISGNSFHARCSEHSREGQGGDSELLYCPFPVTYADNRVYHD